jgi:hypothetical protein
MPTVLRDHISAAELTAHLEQHYSIKIHQITNLDLDIYTVKVNLGGDSWVARVFHQPDAYDCISRLTSLLSYLKQQGLPAEQCVGDDPVSKLSAKGDCVLLTKFVDGKKPTRDKVAFYRLGKLLGQIHITPIPEGAPAGGAWHHLALSGGIQEECMTVLDLLDEFDRSGAAGDDDRHHLAILREEIHCLRASEIEKLPAALVHPDLVLPNIIAQQGSGEHDSWTVVDWAGAGVGPRLLSLGFLLCNAAMHGKIGLANAVMKGYHTSGARLEPSELDQRLPLAIYERYLLIQCWEVAMAREKASVVAERLPAIVEMAQKVANKIRELVKAL